MTTILADAYIPYLKEMLSESCRLITYDSQLPKVDDLEIADALITRTVTPVDDTLLDVGKKLKFIGTATAGFDHIDRSTLSERGIHFRYAPGCNAYSVAEYVVTAILLWAEKKEIEIDGLSLGLVGCGHAGTSTKKLAEKFGLSVICFDPPKALRELDFASADADDVLECDILSFHCALDSYPEYPTWHWLNQERISRCKAKLIINTARGGITDEKALLSAKKDKSFDLVTDVWENEPDFSRTFMKESFIATPHIAGYSVQAKWKGSRMIADQLSGFFGFDIPYVPAPAVGKEGELETTDLATVLEQLHPIMEYDHRLRQLTAATAPERAKGFLKLRSGFPLRHEYSYMRLSQKICDSYPKLKHFNFRQDG